MTDIILSTANARYIHTAFGLRYLFANLGQWQNQASIMEFNINERPLDIAEKILGEKPLVVTFSVYIWNIAILTEVTSLLKLIKPNVIIILGGPEVSFVADLPSIADVADYIVCGEGEDILPKLLSDIFSEKKPAKKIISGPLPNLEMLMLPYDLYTNEDIENRIIYIEASRGCPHGCEFCISSLDKKVRSFPQNKIIEAIKILWQKGARKFKFVDRTLNLGITDQLLNFFLDHKNDGVFLHFEVVPDKISQNLFDIIAQFPQGAIQLEAGVQTFNEKVAIAIGRKQNNQRVETKLKQLIAQTGAHIHSDLIIGLPGEDIESFAKSFDRLFKIGTHEIQVGVLKQLRGAPISRHSSKWNMVYRLVAPYDILKNSLITFEDMQRLKRFSRYFDLVFNSGNFAKTSMQMLNGDSAFWAFMKFSDWLFNKTHQTASIALNRLAELIFEYLVDVQKLNESFVANTLLKDFVAINRRRVPKSVRQFATDSIPDYKPTKKETTNLPSRQTRHVSISK